jgi:hypothetical protein
MQTWGKMDQKDQILTLGSLASATYTNRVSSSVRPFSSFPQAEASLSPAVQIELVRKMSF